MTPGFKEKATAATKSEKAAGADKPEFKNYEDKLSQPTPEISKEEALRRGRAAFEAFIENNREEIDQCSNFRLDKYGKAHNVDGYPGVCKTLARKSKMKELIDAELSEVTQQRKSATPGTVKQKICAKKEAVFTKERNKLNKKIKELKERIQNNQDINL